MAEPIGDGASASRGRADRPCARGIPRMHSIAAVVAMSTTTMFAHEGMSLAPRAFTMSRHQYFVPLMFSSAVWYGCAADMSDSSVYTAQGAEIAATGVQTPRPSPNDAGLGYYEYLPAGYETGAQFPLIVFFHGRGECGDGNTDLPKVLSQGVPKLINNGRDFPAIVI